MCLVGAAPSALATSFTFTTIDYPGAFHTQVWGINDSGEVVGDDAAFGFANENSFLLNGGVFSTVSPPGATGSAAHGINNSGQIVGSNFTAPATTGFLLSGGVYTPISVPGATSTGAFGIRAVSGLL